MYNKLGGTLQIFKRYLKIGYLLEEIFTVCCTNIKLLQNNAHEDKTLKKRIRKNNYCRKSTAYETNCLNFRFLFTFHSVFRLYKRKNRFLLFKHMRVKTSRSSFKKIFTPLVSSPDIETLWKCGTYRSWSSNSSISTPATAAPATDGSWWLRLSSNNLKMTGRYEMSIALKLEHRPCFNSPVKHQKFLAWNIWKFNYHQNFLGKKYIINKY